MRLFVTGGTGFLGSHFLRRALAAGHELTVIRRNGSSPAIPLSIEPEWLECRLEDLTRHILSGYDAVIHFAANGVSPQKTDWKTATEVNVLHSTSLISNACEAGVPKILLCGSCFEYGSSGEAYEFIPANAPLQPRGPYAASKAAFSMIAESMARTSASEFVLLRPFHFYGEGQHPENFWPSLRAAALAGEDFEMTPGEQIRDFQPVEQTADGFLNTLINWPGCQGRMHAENLGSGSPVTLAEFATEMWNQWGARGTLKIGALPYRKGEVMRYVPRTEDRQKL